MKVLCVIPARYASTRLPGKPLANLAGKPMIQRVYERVAQAKIPDEIIVATDDERIKETVEGFGGKGTSSGGQSQYAPHMARAAAAVGVDGLFMEVHDNPAEALSDGPNMIALDKMEQVLLDAKAIDAIGRRE